MQKQYRIGDVVAFRDADYNRVVSQFNTFLPAVNDFLYECELLIGRNLSTEEFLKYVVTSTGLHDIRQEYSKKVKGELVGLVGQLLANSIEESIDKNINKLEFKRAGLNTQYQQYLGGMFEAMDIYHIVLKDGVATYDINKTKARFTTKIETEEQLQIIEKMINVKTVYDDLNDAVKSGGFKGLLFTDNGSGFLEQNADGSLFIDMEAIAAIKAQKAALVA